ncbi:MAG: ComF family protein [Candidatus Aenigmatarchaeota archaeon]
MLKKYLKVFKDLLFPPLCFYCEKKIDDGLLCLNCQNNIEFLYPPLCRYCSIPIKDNKTMLCKNCLGKTSFYERVVSITSYKEPIITLIHLLKYRHYDYISNFLSSLISKHLLNLGLDFSSYDLITSVPLHPIKYKEREYNQSTLLAKALEEKFRIPFAENIIYEKKLKVSQTKLKKDERKENVRDAFLTKIDLKEKNIILVDDILTTGSTISECAKALKEKGANHIFVITLSKTL